MNSSSSQGSRKQLDTRRINQDSQQSSRKEIENEGDNEQKMQTSGQNHFGGSPKTKSDLPLKAKQSLVSQSLAIQPGSKLSDIKKGQASQKSLIMDDSALPSDMYDMESHQFSYEDEVRTSPNFGFKRYLKALYKGEIVDGKRHGLGVMVYENNSRVYEGEWKGDERSGRGYERFKNGGVYVGEFQCNKPWGKGVYTWKNGEVYDGEWRKGKKEGHGVWRGVHGDCYIGEWRNSKAEGYGVHLWKNGDKYEGEWKDMLKHGHGSDFFGNGDTFQGQYCEGKPEGFGQYKWKNGSFYIGDFAAGLKHGKGKWRKSNKPNSNQYEGEYFLDKKHGYGVFTWESGNIYKGNYVEDEREGYGEMYWTDGTVYKGQWYQGCQHGKGKMIMPDGTVLEGYFEMNVFKGGFENEEDEVIQEEIIEENNETTPQMQHEEIPEEIKEVAKEEQSLSKNQQYLSKEALPVFEEDIAYPLETANFANQSDDGNKKPYHYESIPEIIQEQPPELPRISRNSMRRNANQQQVRSKGQQSKSSQQKMKLPYINGSINDLQIQYVTDDSALNMSLDGDNNILNRLNSKSVLESSYQRHLDFNEINVEPPPDDDIDDSNVFARNKKNAVKGGQLPPVIVPQIGFKKAMVSIHTLNLMKKRLLNKSDSHSKWVPNGAQKQSKVFHSMDNMSVSQAPSKMSQISRRKIFGEQF